MIALAPKMLLIFCALMKYTDALKQMLTGMLAWPSRLTLFERWPMPSRIIIGVACDPADVGRLIGREASIVKSLQTIFRAIGTRNNQSILISISAPRLDTIVPTQPRIPKLNPAKEETAAAISQMQDILGMITGAVYPESTVDHAYIGNHHVFILSNNGEMNEEFFVALRVYVRAWARSNGHFFELEHDYRMV